MTPRKFSTPLVFAAALLAGASAQAQVFRAYLASTGVDGPACSLGSPCRLLPAALAVVADGGEIWMLDSANYNNAPVAITKSVTILAIPGALGSVVATAGNAIDIATAGVKVTLRNLVIVPLPGTGGTNGVNMTAGATLTVENCLVANLTGTGINVPTAAIVRVTGSTIRDNSTRGVSIETGARATFIRSTLSGNANFAIMVYGNVASTLTTADIADSTIDANYGGVAALSDHASAAVKVSIRDSRLVRNQGSYGAIAQGAAVTLAASNNVVSNNPFGVVSALAQVWVSGNTVSHNSTGFHNSGGLFESAGDNAVRNNTQDTSGTITPIPTR